MWNNSEQSLNSRRNNEKLKYSYNDIIVKKDDNVGKISCKNLIYQLMKHVSNKNCGLLDIQNIILYRQTVGRTLKNTFLLI